MIRDCAAIAGGYLLQNSVWNGGKADKGIVRFREMLEWEGTKIGEVKTPWHTAVWSSRVAGVVEGSYPIEHTYSRENLKCQLMNIPEDTELTKKLVDVQKRMHPKYLAAHQCVAAI